jgi:nitrate reductase NapD
VNISSIVVKAKPADLDAVEERLRSSGLCEVHFRDDVGHIIVTVEGADAQEEIAKVKEIQNLDGVLTAEMSYAYSDHDFEEKS